MNSYFLYPLLAVCLWGGNNIIGKMSVGVIEPTAISFARWLLAGLILTPFVAPGVWKQRQLIRSLLPKLAVLALLGIVVFQTLAYMAAQTTSATNMGLIGALVPLLTLLLSVPLMRETPTVGTAIGAVVSILGLVLLLTNGHPLSIIDQGINHGDGLLLIGASAYALYGVMLKRWTIPLTLWQSLYMQIMLGVIWQLPLYLFGPSQEISAEAIPLIIYAGIAGSLCATYSWLVGITHLGASRTTMFMNLVPLITCVLAAFWLGEQLHNAQIVGGGLILMGVVLSQRLTKPLFHLTPRPA
ncbi:DMT family transporter [Ferrimonas lipolytica]|uniref:DMT family transporter n=1 Tax=Ferrimonas lipolytica TaxID=2724191 RepID=A0A6H1UAM5_9GAMM|nr:DMT family transporter [Ferrimonas lipolytica]QIZ76117.1 DMT family transporter [Ferrimonas lipolytica]